MPLLCTGAAALFSPEPPASVRPSRSSRLLVAALAVVAALTLTGCAGGSLLNQVVNFWSLSACGTVLAILDVIALVELAGSPRSTGNKIMWAAVVAIFPYVGCLIYYLFGR
ncbi:MAG: hypothetical protein BRD40_04205 [Bacteroidetes bacterium QS_1_65_9]|nr:MAG: hypothetical protein BRD40_04205 [Bacteroidetes bacterium QS_1_65_9]